MTDIFISARRGAGAPAEILYGTVTFKPTLAHSRSTSIVLPAPTTFDLVDGEVVASNVQPTPEPVAGQIEWAYEVTFKDRHSKSYSFLVGVPDSTSQVNFTSLPRYFETKPPLFGQGPQGIPGEAATVSVGTVTGGATAQVTNSGTNTGAVLDFVLPQGPQGPKGDGYTTISDNPLGTEPPSYYPEGGSMTRVTSSSVMATWLGFRGVVTTNRKGSYVVQTIEGTSGEGTFVRVSNNGTSWTNFSQGASTARATQLVDGLMSSVDKTKLDNMVLANDTKASGDLPSTYPEGYSVTRSSTALGWPNDHPSGGASLVTVTTFRTPSSTGGAIQWVKDYYRPSSPLRVRYNNGAGNSWSDFSAVATGININDRTDMYDIALSGADMSGTTDAGPQIAAWLPTLPIGATVYASNGGRLRIDTEVPVNQRVSFTNLNVTTGTNGIAFQVTANGVQFRNSRFTGVGTATYRANRPILRFSGTDLNNRIEDGLVEDCVFRDLQDGAVTYRLARNCHAVRVDIENFCYVGVLFSSVDTHSVSYSRIGRAVQRTNTNSYAIASTDGINTIEARSRDGYFAFNEIFDIPLWEGIDTHGGLRMSVVGNTFRGVRRAICMLQGNNDRVTGAQEITIIGNTIDGSGTGTATTGITLAGTTDLSMLASGTIAGNSVLNCTTPAVISRVDWNKVAVVGNTGIGDGHDKGWQTFEQDSFQAGWFSNSTYPVRYRYSRGNGKTTVDIEGVLSRTSGLNASLIQLPDDLYPGTAKIVGPTSTTTQVTGMLEINSSGRLRFIFAGGTETGNVSVTCSYTF